MPLMTWEAYWASVALVGLGLIILGIAFRRW